MKDFLFSMALGCAAGGLVLSICNIVIDVVAWLRKRAEDKERD